MLEWSLVFWDITFDALSVLELNHLKVGILRSRVRHSLPMAQHYLDCFH